MDQDILIEKAKNGDKEAFCQLIKNVEEKISKVAYFLQPENFEDLLQETYLNAYKSIRKFKGNSKFYTWIYRILLNTNYKSFRKKKIFKKVVNKLQNSEEKEILKEKVRKAVLSLPFIYQEVIIFFYFEGYSVNEISEILNINQGTVKSRLFKAREILKKIINQ